MERTKFFLLILALAFTPPAAMITAMSGPIKNGVPPRPEGPCDIYAAGGSPCVAAHSTTRALYSSYNGPLYQIMRQSDGATKSIGVVKPSEGDAGGYADAAAQDAFCANTTCWITTLYDQSGKANHLTQAPRGAFLGPAMGGFNNIPIADMAPVSVMGHKVYGIFIEPGMGLRLNDAKGTAVDDQAEGQYWVINGHHFNNGCCYDYGNAETDSRDDGDGTMETTYYGNSTGWYHGPGNGPWIMTDQENNLVGCVNPNPNDKACPLPIISWRFVTAMADGEPHHWRSMGGDAQQGELSVMFDGRRITNDRNSYDPMRKQGAILLGNGGDNSNSSQGTFYEGAMTAASTFPTKETNIKIQANIVAARYNVQSVSLAPAGAGNTPPGLQTFAPQSSQNTTVTFTNTTAAPVNGVTLSIAVPGGWKSVVENSPATSKKINETVAPGASVSVTFNVTSGPAAFNGNLIGKATWMENGKSRSESAGERVRNVGLVKINEFRISDGSENATNSFVELYNAGTREIDLSNWTFNEHPTQLPVFSSVKIPAGTKIAAHGFYLLGLSNSGLAVPAKKGESTIFVRSTAGMSAGDVVKIGSGPTLETRTITSLTAPEPEAAPAPGFGGGRQPGPAGSTVIWQPLPEGPVIKLPAGSTNIPVVNVNGFKAGQKMAIGYGATYPAVSKTVEKYEVVTITKVGKAGTQAWLATDAKAGSTNITVSSVANISVGDKIRLDIASNGHGIETVTVARVGTQSSRSPGRGPFTAAEDVGTGLELTAPLKFNHAHNMPFSVNGTGISFEPATSFAHASNEPVLALDASITLDRPLGNNQDINAVVLDEKVKTAGYQGDKAPDQWFGGPALSAGAGNMSLRDAGGNVVDGLNYGGIVDPWLAEGYMATSGAGEGGNFVASPTQFGGRGGFFGQAPGGERPNRSAGRFPDGFDSDDNRNDFQLQNTITLSVATAAGASNLKSTSVANLRAGQMVIVGSGANSETAMIANVGTAGGSTTAAATTAGATLIPVASAAGFEAGQSITIGSDADRETAVVAAVAFARRFGGGNRNAAPPADSVTVTTPLKSAHASNALVAGSGITLSSPLTKAHNAGTQVASHVPTPGMPNQYAAKR